MRYVVDLTMDMHMVVHADSPREARAVAMAAGTEAFVVDDTEYHVSWTNEDGSEGELGHEE